MANKFLPFIVEKSPPHSIYQTMLSRSKGVNDLTFLNVFIIVCKHGIKKVRDYVDSQSEKVSTSTLYQEISNHFGHFVDKNDYDTFNLLQNSMSIGDLTLGDLKFSEYGYSDILGFIYALSVLGRSSEYFDSIDYENYLKNHPHVMNNLKEFITLDDDNYDHEIVVENRKDLIANILYYSLISPIAGSSYKIKKFVPNKEEEEDTPPESSSEEEEGVLF